MKMRTLFGDSLVQVILYGSYARGDYQSESDIDIMILTSYSDDIIRQYDEKVSDVTYDFNWEHDVLIKPIVLNVKHFDYWKGAYMFYKNVANEGVVIA